MLSKPKTAHGRYLVRLFGLMSLYLSLLFIAVRFLERPNAVTGPLAYILAFGPAVPVIGIFWAVARLIIEMKDEYQRLLLVRQTLVATGFALSLATGWGFLEQFSLAPHIPAYYWAVVWFAGLGVGAAFNRFTMGDSGGCI
ncbi:MAG: hypothetical protein AABZ45_09085 [Pseudomonadota bacterium]